MIIVMITTIAMIIMMITRMSMITVMINTIAMIIMISMISVMINRRRKLWRKISLVSFISHKNNISVQKPLSGNLVHVVGGDSCW